MPFLFYIFYLVFQNNEWSIEHVGWSEEAGLKEALARKILLHRFIRDRCQSSSRALSSAAPGNHNKRITLHHVFRFSLVALFFALSSVRRRLLILLHFSRTAKDAKNVWKWNKFFFSIDLLVAREINCKNAWCESEKILVRLDFARMWVCVKDKNNCRNQSVMDGVFAPFFVDVGSIFYAPKSQVCPEFQRTIGRLQKTPTAVAPGRQVVVEIAEHR